MSPNHKPLPHIILASSSPRRKELLSALGVPFTVQSPDVDEHQFDQHGLSPQELVERLSSVKAQAVYKQVKPNNGHAFLVVAADTIVVINNQILGKPVSEQHAVDMLRLLAGTTHQVWSGITVMNDLGEVATQAWVTEVTMRALTDDQIWQYVDTGEPMDKAGAYAIQGYGSLLVEQITGCYFNVVGMSMALLETLFESLGYSLLLSSQPSTEDAVVDNGPFQATSLQ